MKGRASNYVRERHARAIRHPHEVGFWLRPALAGLWQLEHPNHPVNDAAWIRQQAAVWINGRWLPAVDAVIDSTTPHVGHVDWQIAYAVLPEGESPVPDDLEAWLNVWKQRLPNHAVSGTMHRLIRLLGWFVDH